MSICRWSSDAFKSDVYAYESVYGGVEINVASSRYVGDIPSLGDVRNIDGAEFVKRRKAQSEALKKCKTEPIGGQFDGESFSCGTWQQVLDVFLMLYRDGYHIPDYAFLEVLYNLGITPNYKLKSKI